MEIQLGIFNGVHDGDSIGHIQWRANTNTCYAENLVSTAHW